MAFGEPFGAQSVPKVSPKASKMVLRAPILKTFFCKKTTLHPTAYLLCFRHILRVLGSPVLKKFLLEMCVGSRSPKKAVTLSLFLIFRRKCIKMGAQMGGKVQKIVFFCSFTHWSPFGCPWLHFHWILGSLGIILALFWMRSSTTREPKIQWKWILKPTGLGS